MGTLHLLNAVTGGSIATLSLSENFDSLDTDSVGKMLSFEERHRLHHLPSQEDEVVSNALGEYQLGNAKAFVSMGSWDGAALIHLRIESTSAGDLVALRCEIRRRLGFKEHIIERPQPDLSEISLITAARNDLRRLWRRIRTGLKPALRGPLFKLG